MLYPLIEKRTITLLFLLCFAFIPGQAISQGPPLNPGIKTYPPSTYEDHPQVFCAARDSAGAMWFGSAEGVLHFSGETWKKVPTSSGMSVLAMDIDHEGRIWVGGQSEFGYLRPISPSDTTNPGRSSQALGGMEYISLTHLVPDSLRDFNIVWNIHALDGRVFFKAHNVIFVLEGDSLQALHPRKEFYLSFEVNEALWVHDRDKGLYRLKKDGGDNSVPDTSLSLEKLPGSRSLARKEIIKVLASVSGMTEEREVLVLTRFNGLYRYHYGNLPKGKEDRLTPIGAKWRPFLSKADIYHAIPISPDTNPWDAPLAVSTNRKGAMLLDSLGRPVHVLDQSRGMTANGIWQTAKGASGSGMLWSATNKGIVRWTPGNPRTFAREGKAFSGGVEDITRYRGQLFIATLQGVYVRTNGKDPGKSEWLPISGQKGQSYVLVRTRDEDRQKSSLLVAADVLFEIRPQQGNPEGEGAWKAHRISGKHAYSLTELPISLKGQWIAFGGNAGIVVLSCQKEQKWQEELHIKGLPEEVHALQGTSPKKGVKVDLWSGLPSKGGVRIRLDSTVLSRALRSDSLRTIHYEKLSKKKGINLSTFTGKGEARKGLPKGGIRFFPFRERIVASTGSGLYRLSKSPGDTFHWTPDTTMGCLFLNCTEGKAEKIQGGGILHEAGDGSVWISSKTAYHFIPKAKGGYRVDSLPFKGLDLGAIRAFYPDSNGITWIGGSNGLARYDQKIEKDFRRDYPCFIREVTAPLQDTGRAKKDSLLFKGFYRKRVPDDSLLGWKRAWDQPESFVPTLPYEMNGIIFNFAAPYYESQDELEYSYRLEGFDKGWSQWKKETRKAYTNLPEGSYTFRVKAKNIYGVESEIGEYSFRILPPWYRTWTAFGGYTLAGVGFIWLLLWLNSRRLVAQKQRLERTVEERTQEIREQKEEVEKQKEKVEEAHQEITASIDYAQKIQNALLQSEEYASDHIPEHFILFKPQATVSGDFYWAREQNGYLYFAAIDCTGHGVPGAFMSMLGISQLNEIMAGKGSPSPGAILTELRERVVAELSSGDHGEGAKDGMDAALLRIPLDEEGTKTVAFAGAQNPLYIVRKGIGEDLPTVRFGHSVGATHPSPLHDTPQHGSLDHRVKPFKKSSDGFEVKGDPMPVGYDEYASGDFTTVSIQAQKGDMLYIFSDGYADQFGGPKGKKFRYGPFKELLARIHTMTPEDQKKELDRIFEEWKDGQEQVDDVCVVGIRI